MKVKESDYFYFYDFNTINFSLVFRIFLPSHSRNNFLWLWDFFLLSHLVYNKFLEILYPYMSIHMMQLYVFIIMYSWRKYRKLEEIIILAIPLATHHWNWGSKSRNMHEFNLFLIYDFKMPFYSIDSLSLLDLFADTYGILSHLANRYSDNRSLPDMAESIYSTTNSFN